MASKSLAAAGLCSWVLNIVKFYQVFCEVEPKRQALSKANAELAAAQDKLSVIKSKINVRKWTAFVYSAIAISTVLKSLYMFACHTHARTHPHTHTMQGAGLPIRKVQCLAQGLFQGKCSLGSQLLRTRRCISRMFASRRTFSK